MGLFMWIVIGGLIGWLAAKTMKNTESQELISNIIVGMVGAIMGGFFAQAISRDNVGSLDLNSAFFAILGAILLVAVVKMFSNFNKL